MENTALDPPAPERPRIVETDGATVRLVCGPFELIGSLSRHGDELHLDGVHVGGLSRNQLGLPRLREMARHFLEDQHARRLVVHGAKRTSGASPGRRPQPMFFDVAGR
jgi:hypothetical protein